MVSNDELKAFHKRVNENVSKAYSSRVTLPNKKNDRDRDLYYITRQLYKTQKNAEQHVAILALHDLIPNIPLERKLNDYWCKVWKSMNSDRPMVRRMNKFKSKNDSILWDLNKKQRINKIERIKHQKMLREWENLDRVIMSESLRNDTMNIIRKELNVIRHETNNEAKNESNIDDYTSQNMNSIVTELGRLIISDKQRINIVNTVKNNIKLCKNNKVSKFVERIKEILISDGFNSKDVNEAAYLIFDQFICKHWNSKRLNKNEDYSYAVIKDTGSVMDEYKAFNEGNYDMNGIIDECTTYLCLNVDEDKLPKKYSGKGKQFEIETYHDEPNEDKDDVDGDVEITEEERKSVDNDVLQRLVEYGFPQKMCIQCILESKKYEENDKLRFYSGLVMLYKTFLGYIGNDDVKESLNNEVDSDAVSEMESVIKEEFNMLNEIYTGDNAVKWIDVSVLSSDNERKSFGFSKELRNGKGKFVGLLEIYFIGKYKKVYECVYPQQIPIIVVKGKDGKLKRRICSIIMQNLVAEVSSSIGGEMGFSIIDWLDNNLDDVMKKPNEFDHGMCVL